MKFTMKLDPDGKIRPKLNRWTPAQTWDFFKTHWEFADLGYESQCWRWTGCFSPNGYGVIKFKGKNVPAHRYSAIIHIVRPVSDGLLVCHKCDQPCCVNPDHLYWGTHKQNTRDMIQRGRAIHPKGEQASLSKLTAEKVAEIRRLRASKLTFRKIASMMGVTKSAIQGIIYGETWRHVP